MDLRWAQAVMEPAAGPWVGGACGWGLGWLHRGVRRGPGDASGELTWENCREGGGRGRTRGTWLRGTAMWEGDGGEQRGGEKQEGPGADTL